MSQTREVVDRKGGQRRYTDEGFLVVPARIARIGIQEYRAFELGINDGEPMRVIRVYRAPDEVFDPEAMASFDGKPITDDHPAEFVDSTNWARLAKGFARNIRRDGDYLVADLVIADKQAIDKILAGKVELSNGYGANYDWTPGTTPDGEQYDAQQRNIRGNHVAIVDAARCGPACRVSDQQTTKGNTMAEKTVTIDGAPYQLPEAAAAAVEKLVADNAALTEKVKNPRVKVGDTEMTGEEVEGKLAEKEGELAEKDKALAEKEDALKEKDKELADAKANAMTPEQRDAMVEAWAGMVDGAQKLIPGYDHKGKTCEAIRREVVGKLQADAKHKPMIDAALGGVAVADAPADLIKTTFNVLAAAAAVASNDSPTGEHLGNAIKNALTNGGTTDGQQLHGRDLYEARLTGRA